MNGGLRQFATSFVIVLVVELLVRAGLHWWQGGNFQALLKGADVIQALVVAGVLAVVFARMPRRSR